MDHFQICLMSQSEQTMVVLRVVVVVVEQQQQPPRELEKKEQVLQARPCFFCAEIQPFNGAV